MKTKLTVEALALVGMAAGLAVTSGCRTTYSDSADLSLTPMPASLEPEPVGNVTYPKAEAEKAKPYWQQHPDAVAALDKAPAVSAAAAKAGAGYSTYVVKPGDSLSKIAVAHGFRTADVLAVNPGISPNKIRAGQTIVLPGAKAAQPKTDVKVQPPKVPAAQPKAESKPAVAPVAQPAVAPVAQPAVAPVAQPAVAPVVKDVAPPAIVAPTPAPLAPPTVEATPPAAKGTPYVVQEGQDLFDISVKWGVSATEIKALNNLTSDDVTPGQTLMIPAPRAE